MRTNTLLWPRRNLASSTPGVLLSACSADQYDMNIHPELDGCVRARDCNGDDHRQREQGSERARKPRASTAADLKGYITNRASILVE